MAKRARSEETVETDRIEGVDHPRATFRLVGQGTALARAARALRAGRPPHAWLLAGPPGIGKATLAYRIARYLLRYGATAEGPEDLSLPENDPVSIRVRAGSHPGLMVLKRGLNPKSGKPMTALSVDEVRRLGGFFGLTSGAGGWRVAIVDSADELNDQAANALLKTLEEPPSRGMLLLLADAPARLLPTIRSRCQQLNLRPLSDGELDAEMSRQLPELSVSERSPLVRLAHGSIGGALRLAREGGLEMAVQIEQLIESAAMPDFPATLALAERIARLEDGTEAFGALLAQALASRILARARENARDVDRWVELWERVRVSFGRTAALHLEPRQTILSAVSAVSRTARHATL